MAIDDVALTAAQSAAASATSAAASAELAAEVALGVGGVDGYVASLVDNPASDVAASLSASIDSQAEPGSLRNGDKLTRWRSALIAAARGGARATIACEGDSITAGAWVSGAGGTPTSAQATEWAKRGWVGQLRSMLALDFGDSGEGYIGHAGEETRWTYTGTHSGSQAVAVGQSAKRWTGSAGADGGTASIVLDPSEKVSVLGYWYSGANAMRAELDGVDVTPTVLSAAQKACTGEWSAVAYTLTYTTDGGENVISSTVTGGGGIAARTGDGTGATGRTVEAGKSYLLVADIEPTVDTHNATVSVVWWDASNVQIGAEVASTQYTTTLNQYQHMSLVATAPANAVRATMFVRFIGPHVSDNVLIRRPRMVPLAWTAAGFNSTFYRFDVTTGGSVTKTLTLKAGTGMTDSLGILVEGDSTAKMRVNRLPKSGSTSRDHAGGGLSANAVTNLMVGTIQSPGTPNLLVVMLGANDYNTQNGTTITAAQYKINLKVLIDNAVALGASVLLLAGPRWSDDTKTENQAAFYTKAAELSDENSHVAFADLADIWGDYDRADARGYMFDSPHPNLKGHASIARWVKELVTDRALIGA